MIQADATPTALSVQAAFLLRRFVLGERDAQCPLSGDCVPTRPNCGLSTGRRKVLANVLTKLSHLDATFLRLANALFALYPCENEEKRLLDAMLLAVPR